MVEDAERGWDGMNPDDEDRNALLNRKYTPADFMRCSDALDCAYSEWAECDPEKDKAVRLDRKETLWIKATRFALCTPVYFTSFLAGAGPAFHDAINEVVFDVLEGRSPYRSEFGPFSRHFYRTLQYRAKDMITAEKRGLAPRKTLAPQMRWILDAARILEIEPTEQYSNLLAEEIRAEGHEISVEEVRRTLARHLVVSILGDGSGASESDGSFLEETLADPNPSPEQTVVGKSLIDGFRARMTSRIQDLTNGQTREILLRMLEVSLDRAERTGRFGSLEEEGHREVQSKDLAFEFDVTPAYISKMKRKYTELAAQVWIEESGKE
jgi:hypothetical protein